MKTDSDNIEKLRRAVEHRFGRGVNTPNEFQLLVRDIKAKSGFTVGVSTVMRLWGYVRSDVKPSLTTLNMLASYAGYHDYQSLVNGDDDGSGTVVSEHLNVDNDLSPRDHLLLRWQPGRECLVRYMGAGQFVVERAVRTKLSVGDTFTCHLVVQGHPLYIDDLVHESMPPRCYICGHHNGIRFEVIKTEE